MNVKFSINQKYSVFFRGQLNAVLQSAFGLGDLVGMVLSMRPVLGSVEFSPYVLAFTFFLSSFEFLVLIFAKESPRFLILRRKKLLDGKLALEYYQGKDAGEKGVQEIQSEAGRLENTPKGVYVC